MSGNPDTVLIIGARGEFGEFLQSDILPALGVGKVLTVERDTARDEYLHKLRQAEHIIIATPLSGYAERACEIVFDCRDFNRPITFWLIPSVQAGVSRAVNATLAKVLNPHLAAVFVHPMYGPNGFRSEEREAQTFRNILTGTTAGNKHPVTDEVAQVFQSFSSNLGIETTSEFDPESHDRATACSQGLSYCVARVMFDRPEIDALVLRQMPDLHLSFHANHNLIDAFIRLNTYMPAVTAVFMEAWDRTTRSSYEDLMSAFAEADVSLNHSGVQAIPTKWYEKLRNAAIES
jgi:hypothetical protein